MTHLTSDELIDAMEGMLAAERQAHLASCEACQRQVAELSSVLNEAKQLSVPEPSPLFWQHFSDRVRTSIDNEGVPGTGVMPAWWRWQVLAPVGALALVILALMIAVPKQEAPPAADKVWTDLKLTPIEELTADENWMIVASMVGALDWDTATAVGVTVKPDAADQAVLQLTAEEQQELTRLLKAELMRAKS
jgi:hypothetical protein